jgi:hypothetical protein
MQVSPNTLAADIRTLETNRVACIDCLSTFEQEERRSGTCGAQIQHAVADV